MTTWLAAANALRHGAGEITVSAAPTPVGVAVEVCDEGRGVVGADVERIFDRGSGRATASASSWLARWPRPRAAGSPLEAAGANPCFRLLIPPS